jgi:hypothetical protein
VTGSTKRSVAMITTLIGIPIFEAGKLETLSNSEITAA